MWAGRPTPLAGGAVGIVGLPGRIYNPPLQTRLLPFPAVGAHCICAHAAPPGSPGLQSSHPGPGGMWAGRPTPLAGGAVGIAGLPGRIYNPPLQTRLLPFPAVGAHCICAHAAPPGSPGLQSSHPGPGGMWAGRPTPLAGGAVGIAGLPGRIYNPPLQTRLLPFPAVGAHCICAHAAPPGSPGLQSSHPGPGGMWACRPTFAAVGGLPCTRNAMRAPTANGTIQPRRESEAGSGRA